MNCSCISPSVFQAVDNLLDRKSLSSVDETYHGNSNCWIDMSAANMSDGLQCDEWRMLVVVFIVINKHLELHI